LGSGNTLVKSSIEIAKEFELTPELTAEILALAQEHKPEVDAYVADYQAELDRHYAAYEPGPDALRIGRLVAERQARDGTRWGFFVGPETPRPANGNRDPDRCPLPSYSTRTFAVSLFGMRSATTTLAE
jgi:hypothetical protein